MWSRPSRGLGNLPRLLRPPPTKSSPPPTSAGAATACSPAHHRPPGRPATNHLRPHLPPHQQLCSLTLGTTLLRYIGIRKGVERDPTLGTLVVCRETKLLGKRASRLEEDVDSADDGIQEKDKFLAKCPFRCAVREEIGVSAAWRGISLWGNDVSPLVLQPVPRKSPQASQDHFKMFDVMIISFLARCAIT